MYATNNIPLSFNKLLPRFTTKFDILIHVLQKEKKNLKFYYMILQNWIT